MNGLSTNSLFTTICLIALALSSNLAISASDAPRKPSVSKKKDTLELETLKIQGNKELPRRLYIVPWRDVKKSKGKKQKQRLVLHSLYGDLFDPVNPNGYLDKTE